MNDISKRNNQMRVHSADWDGSPTRGMKVKELNHAYNNMPAEAFMKWRNQRT